MKKTAILIHGCNLDAPFWEEVVWGTLEHKGRILKGIEEALERNAEVLIWGSGLATGTGIVQKESHYTFEYAMERVEFLASFFNMNEEKLRSYLTKVSVFDEISSNTKTEVENALALCKERGMEELYLVSSSPHISRCLLEAFLLKEEMHMNHFSVYGAPSDSYPDAWKPQDVVVIEPQHRADRPHIPFHIFAKRMLAYQNNPEKAEPFFAELSAVVDRFDGTSL